MSGDRPDDGAEGLPPILIHLWIRTREPVAGEVAVDGGPASSFR